MLSATDLLLTANPADRACDMSATAKRHTAKITPFVTGIRFGGVVLAVAIIQFFNIGVGRITTALVIGFLILVAILIATFAIAYLQWQRLEFWFDDDGDFRVTSGVVQRRERRLQLSRLQSVEVVQPLLARVFGMAELRVEVAGGGDSRITLAYLTLTDAQALRAETLARAAGVRPDAGEAPENILVHVPGSTLFWSTLLSSGVWISFVTIVVFSIILTLTNAWVASISLLFLLIIPILVSFGGFATYFNFTVAESPDGLRTRSGLFSVQAHTVPPGRVASMELVEPILWRKFGWVMVKITVAGAKSSDDDSQGSTANILLPVAPRDVAIGVIHRIYPGVELDQLPLTPVPRRCRKRAPFQWKKLAAGTSEKFFVSRRGWLTTRTTITPHARVQSVRMTQGPWERALHLASVHADIVPGPVSVVALHRPIQEARDLLIRENHLAQESVRTERWSRWATPEIPPPGEEPAADASPPLIQDNQIHPPRSDPDSSL